jgi:hypothetical protein
MDTGSLGVNVTRRRHPRTVGFSTNEPTNGKSNVTEGSVVASDVVDGAPLPASMCHKVIVKDESH